MINNNINNKGNGLVYPFFASLIVTTLMNVCHSLELNHIGHALLIILTKLVPLCQILLSLFFFWKPFMKNHLKGHKFYVLFSVVDLENNEPYNSL